MSAAGPKPILLAALVALLCLAHAQAQKAPRFKACKRGLPPQKLNECVRDALQKAVPELVKGLPDFGLATVDPLRVDAIDVGKGKSAVSVDINLKNIDIHGLKYSKIRSAEIEPVYKGKDLTLVKLKTKVDIDGSIMLRGDYSVRGKVLVLPIEGAGKCNITLVRPKGEITEFVVKPLDKGGKQFSQTTVLKFVVYDVERVIFDLKNLFNGNKALGENMNLVLNDNWKQVFEDLRGPVQSAFGAAFKSIASRVGRKLPFQSILAP